MTSRYFKDFIFIGGTYRGFRVLEALLARGYIPSRCFILEEDRHEELRFSPKIKELLSRAKITFALRRKLTEADYEYIQKHSFDFAIVCGWRTMIDSAIIKSFKFGLVAAHDSLLPKYRGFAPLNWALINGEGRAGVTLFLVNDKGVDSGDIILQKRILINDNEYARDLYEKVTSVTADLCLDFFDRYRKGNLKVKKQSEAAATYGCRRRPEDGKINWQMPARQVFNFIRALASPYPGAFCNYATETYHIRKARLPAKNRKYAGSIPGRVVNFNPEGIEVLCGNGSIIITEWENKARGIIECPSSKVKSISATLT